MARNSSMGRFISQVNQGSAVHRNHRYTTQAWGHENKTLLIAKFSIWSAWQMENWSQTASVGFLVWVSGCCASDSSSARRPILPSALFRSIHVSSVAASKCDLLLHNRAAQHDQEAFGEPFRYNLQHGPSTYTPFMPSFSLFLSTPFGSQLAWCQTACAWWSLGESCANCPV